MSPRRRRVGPDLTWDRLESREVPAPFVGPLPVSPPTTRPAPETRADLLQLDVLLARQAARGTPSVAFYGDSITYNFGFYYGSDVWARSIAPLSAMDFGVPSDTTQNILWRIEDGGELRGQPRVAVVEAGINNLIGAGDSPAATYEGIEAVVAAIHWLSPATKVLVIGMLPFGGPGNPFRPMIAAVNAALAASVDDSTTYFLDVGKGMVDPDGSIAADFEPDLGHPNARGYQAWTGAMIGLLDQLLGVVPAPSPPPFVGPLPQPH